MSLLTTTCRLLLCVLREEGGFIHKKSSWLLFLIHKNLWELYSFLLLRNYELCVVWNAKRRRRTGRNLMHNHGMMASRVQQKVRFFAYCGNRTMLLSIVHVRDGKEGRFISSRSHFVRVTWTRGNHRVQGKKKQKPNNNPMKLKRETNWSGGKATTPEIVVSVIGSLINCHNLQRPRAIDCECAL